MFPPFPQEQAFEFCKNLILELKKGSVKLEQITSESKERSGQGIMLGVLLCHDNSGRLFILKCCSGISKNLVRFSESNLEGNRDFTEIFVEPVVSAEKINQALSQNDLEIHSLTDKINQLKTERKASSCNLVSEEENLLARRRQELCNSSLKKVYDLYSFNCIDGSEKSLLQITKGKLPPTGTGDCCAPKLLNYAFKNKLVPFSMAELFYNPCEEIYLEKLEPVPPCDERCGLILPEMLGLKIVYRDENLVVVDKQSGLLSVPGRGPEKQDCIVNRLKKIFPQCMEQPSVHRLDMETSGLVVLAFDSETHKKLNRQFENREVQKEYIAVLEGIVRRPDYENNLRLQWDSDSHGKMELYFRVDLDNRPHQMWDEEYGKQAITEFEILNYENYKTPDGNLKKSTRVRFIPHTGRTHQLRLASADIHGFGHQIIGDTLYGICNPGERLLLHAQYLSFVHPVSGKKMEFFLPPEF